LGEIPGFHYSFQVSLQPGFRETGVQRSTFNTDTHFVIASASWPWGEGYRPTGRAVSAALPPQMLKIMAEGQNEGLYTVQAEALWYISPHTSFFFFLVSSFTHTPHHYHY